MMGCLAGITQRGTRIGAEWPLLGQLLYLQSLVESGIPETQERKTSSTILNQI